MMRNLPFLKQDNDGNFTVSWDSPSPFPSSYPIEHFFFNITCIYGDFIEHVSVMLCFIIISFFCSTIITDYVTVKLLLNIPFPHYQLELFARSLVNIN